MNFKFLFASTKVEFFMLFREKSYVFFSVIFPALLYTFYTSRIERGASEIHINFAIYCCAFSVFAVTFFQYCLGTSNIKSSNWGVFLQNLPVDPLFISLGRLFASFVFCLLAISFVFLVAALTNKTFIPPIELPRIYFSLFFGSVPFSFLGFFIGNTFSKSNSLIISNIIYAGFSFLGGFWIGKDTFSSYVDFLPTKIWIDIILYPDSSSLGLRLLTFLAWSLLFLGLAIFSSRYFNFISNRS
jgi:ABC-2 type transport system permease protein